MEPNSFTPFDNMTQTRELQMLKTAIPYMKGDQKKQFAILIKYMELQNTIQHCLRKGDSFTKYSLSQYLVLLIGTNKENCGLIFDRIRKYFAREHRSWNKYVEFYVSSVAEVDNLDTPIQFRNDDSGWK